MTTYSFPGMQPDGHFTRAFPADRWSKAVDLMLREFHQSCLDRGFYYPHLMKRYGDRPIQIQPPSEWAVFP